MTTHAPAKKAKRDISSFRPFFGIFSGKYSEICVECGIPITSVTNHRTFLRKYGVASGALCSSNDVVPFTDENMLRYGHGEILSNFIDYDVFVARVLTKEQGVATSRGSANAENVENGNSGNDGHDGQCADEAEVEAEVEADSDDEVKVEEAEAESDDEAEEADEAGESEAEADDDDVVSEYFSHSDSHGGIDLLVSLPSADIDDASDRTMNHLLAASSRVLGRRDIEEIESSAPYEVGHVLRGASACVVVPHVCAAPFDGPLGTPMPLTRKSGVDARSLDVHRWAASLPSSASALLAASSTCYFIDTVTGALTSDWTKSMIMIVPNVPRRNVLSIVSILPDIPLFINGLRIVGHAEIEPSVADFSHTTRQRHILLLQSLCVHVYFETTM